MKLAASLAVMGILALLAVLDPSSCLAAPYFRFFDPAKPYQVTGAFVDPRAPGQTSAGSLTAIITHSPKDGCLLPAITCEEWAPLALGLSGNAGRFYMDLGPLLNAAPSVQRALIALYNRLSETPWAAAPSRVAVAFGPNLNVRPFDRGIVLPLNQWQGRLRIFAGAGLRFE